MGGGLVLNTVQICAMVRSILLILALPYTLRFSLFEQYWPLRALSEQEERELKRRGNATSERLDVVRRAKALGAVADGKPLTQAAQEAGLKSGDGVGKLVKRFNQHGLAALWVAARSGRKPTYTSEQRARILPEVQRQPDRKEARPATWSLMTPRRALRKRHLPDTAAATIREG